MGSEDIPGSINYILNLTGEKKLSFVCLSFGCTLFFIAMIVQPELNNSIEVAVALAPSGRLSNVQNAFATKFLAPYWDEIEVMRVKYLYYLKICLFSLWIIIY
jgi:lysosomal acid lipase/cholesteryl ester hydrolase